MFNQLLQLNHELIHLTSLNDMNEPEQCLAFVLGEKRLPAEHNFQKLTRSGFQDLISALKADLTRAAEQLLGEIQSRFPHPVMDWTRWVLYTRSTGRMDTRSSLSGSFDVLQDYFGDAKWIGEGDKKQLIPAVFGSVRKLESELPLIKLSMASNTANAMEPAPLGRPDHLKNLNPLTKLWRILDSNVALASHFGEYVKLTKIAMVQVLGSVEDERVFSSLNFLKDKTRNRLDY